MIDMKVREKNRVSVGCCISDFNVAEQLLSYVWINKSFLNYGLNYWCAIWVCPWHMCIQREESASLLFVLFINDKLCYWKRHIPFNKCLFDEPCRQEKGSVGVGCASPSCMQQTWAVPHRRAGTWILNHKLLRLEGKKCFLITVEGNSKNCH